ncbi:MAG: leucine-rich repeat domain-containing protein [Christensenellaceae bacterium]|jgi:LPXTG-motif cell wall-anchored protein
MKKQTRFLGLLLVILLLVSLVPLSAKADNADLYAYFQPHAKVAEAVAAKLGINAGDPVPNNIDALLAGITEIDLSGCEIVDLRNIGSRLSGLTSLNLSSNSIHGVLDYGDGNFVPALAPLANLTQLQTLNLSENRSLTSWADQGMEGSRVPASTLAPLSSLTNLTSLNLFNTQISQGGLDDLPNSLTTLDISLNAVGDNGILALSHLTNLTDFRASDVQCGSDAMDVIASWPNLVRLNVAGNPISSPGVQKIAETAPNSLISLDIRGTSSTDQSAAYLKTSGLKFEELCVTNNDFSVTGLKDIQASMAEGFVPLADPVRQEGVSATATKNILLGETYSLDLSDIFYSILPNPDDTDAKPAYCVSLNGATPIMFTDPVYSYKPTQTGTYVLVFTAGLDDIESWQSSDSSDAYTVTLNVTEEDVSPSPSPSPSETPSPSPSGSESPSATDNGTGTPATGDNANMMLYIAIIAAIVLLGAVSIIAVKKKENR